MSSTDSVSPDVSLSDVVTLLRELDQKVQLLITKVDSLAEFLEEDIAESDDETPPALSPVVGGVPSSRVGIPSLPSLNTPYYMKSQPLRRSNAFPDAFGRSFGPIDERYNPYRRPFQK
jgi:hypothetical protein